MNFRHISTPLVLCATIAAAIAACFSPTAAAHSGTTRMFCTPANIMADLPGLQAVLELA